METQKYFKGEKIGISGTLKEGTTTISNIPAYLQIMQNGKLYKEVQMTVVSEVYGYELDTSAMEGIFAFRVVLKPTGRTDIIVSKNPVPVEILK